MSPKTISTYNVRFRLEGLSKKDFLILRKVVESLQAESRSMTYSEKLRLDLKPEDLPF